METLALTEVKKHLRRGRVYRREDLAKWSDSVDRHLKTLVAAGDLKKLRYGMYYCPKRLAFGEAPASEHELVRAFLKEFLLVDLVNEVDQLAEDRGAVLARVRENAVQIDSRKLSRAVSLYANYSSQRWWKSLG